MKWKNSKIDKPPRGKEILGAHRAGYSNTRWYYAVDIYEEVWNKCYQEWLWYRHNVEDGSRIPPTYWLPLPKAPTLTKKEKAENSKGISKFRKEALAKARKEYKEILEDLKENERSKKR